uniref:FAD-binding FR-type domain-containing protein n=1 Tax=Phytophthora ramorum TaxID=164328 RepID=H3GF98_PHYRM
MTNAHPAPPAYGPELSYGPIENRVGDVFTPSNPYVHAVSPKHQSVPEELSRTQKWVRAWVVTRWRLSRTIYAVPVPLLTAKFDIKRGDLVLTLPLLLILLAASGVFTSEHDVKMSGMPPTFTMMLVFGLAVRNNSLLLTLTGIPFERALFYHKLFAYATIVLTALHAFSHRLADDDGEEEDMEFKVRTGAIAYVAMIFMYLFSLNKIRRRFFELFVRVHWILFIVVIVAAVAHGAFFALFGILPWLVDMLYRLVFRARNYIRGPSKRGAQTGIVARDQVSVHALPGDITRIQFPRVRKDNGQAFEYEAGQYAFLCIPTISSLEWHPFTISSSPSEEMVTFHIKGLGDWTKKVTSAAQDAAEESPFDILLDGPYGSVSVDIHSPSVYSHFVLFSGGIGITPMRSIVNWLHSESHNGFRPDIKNVHFVWSVRDRNLIQALVTETEAHQDGPYFPALVQDPTTLNTPTSTFYSEFYLTRGERDVEAQLDHQLSNCLRYGSRPDTAKILRAMGEKAQASGSSRVAVLVCGPKPLVDGIVTTGLTLSKDMNISFDVHTELFDF